MNDYLEWIGYLASSIVLISLLMSSIKKLRWINLGGALLFGVYGFAIGSIPTGLMNVGIVAIDIFYLVRMYKQKDFFRVLPIEDRSDYFKAFVDFYKDDINGFVDITNIDIDKAKIKLYILRNMTPAGIFVADEVDSKTLEIKFDYVIPMYRDFKVGNFVFESQREYFLSKGYEKFIASTDNVEHISYIKKMGFELTDSKENLYIKNI